MFIKRGPKGTFQIDDRHISPASSLSTRWLLRTLVRARAFASGRLLDVGCSSKPYEEVFTAETYFGIDWPGSQHKLSIDAIADAHHLPFKAASFNTVLCTEVIEHLRDPSRSIQEMARLLVPGGYLILSAPFTHELHEYPHDFFRFTSFGLQSLARKAGLTPVKCWARGSLLTVIADLATRGLSGGINSIFNRIRLRGGVRRFFQNLLISWPQRLFARLDFFIDNLRSAAVDQPLDTAKPRIALGYVIVSRKPKPVQAE